MRQAMLDLKTVVIAVILILLGALIFYAIYNDIGSLFGALGG